MAGKCHVLTLLRVTNKVSLKGNLFLFSLTLNSPTVHMVSSQWDYYKEISNCSPWKGKSCP